MMSPHTKKLWRSCQGSQDISTPNFSTLNFIPGIFILLNFNPDFSSRNFSTMIFFFWSCRKIQPQASTLDFSVPVFSTIKSWTMKLLFNHVVVCFLGLKFRGWSLGLKSPGLRCPSTVSQHCYLPLHLFSNCPTSFQRPK